MQSSSNPAEYDPPIGMNRPEVECNVLHNQELVRMQRKEASLSALASAHHCSNNYYKHKLVL